MSGRVHVPFVTPDWRGLVGRPDVSTTGPGSGVRVAGFYNDREFTGEPRYGVIVPDLLEPMTQQRLTGLRANMGVLAVVVGLTDTGATTWRYGTLNFDELGCLPDFVIALAVPLGRGATAACLGITKGDDVVMWNTRAVEDGVTTKTSPGLTIEELGNAYGQGIPRVRPPEDLNIIL